MGLSYSFTFYTLRSKTDAALQAVASIAADAALRDWLLRGVPYEPADTVTFRGRDGRIRQLGLGVKGMDLTNPFAGDGGSKNYHCLSLLLPNDTQHWTDPWPGDAKPTIFGQTVVPVGCIYLSVFAGERFSIIHLAAATGEMSRHFERSTGTQSTMTRLGGQMGALACVLGLEGNGPYPVLGRAMVLDPIDPDDFEIENIVGAQPQGYFCMPDADVCAMEVLRKCGVDPAA